MSEVIAQWQLYICRACGLIYDEREGDPDSGLAPGTRFEDIPDDWECPLCGVTKSDFEPFERPVITGAAPVAAQHKTGIIIIGAGIAGWAMAEAIRRVDVEVPISLITACPGDVYHKPELSLAIARGQRAKELIRETGIDAATRLRVNLLPHTFVMGVCSVTKTVRTTRGTFNYHNLVLAQGAKARAHEKIPAEWSWRVNHLSSWSGLQQRLEAGPRRVAIIGGGLVGCELAENLCRAGHQVEFVFRSASLLPALLPEQVGLRLEEQLKSIGVRCYRGADVQDARQSPDGFDLQLSGNTQLAVDHIITATGLDTDTRIARLAGLAFDQGISVDAQTLATSKPHIFALGDCISLAGNPCRFIAPIDAQASVIASQIYTLNSVTEHKTAIYDHQPPTIRVKVQSCSLVVRGQPTPCGQWQTLTDDGKQLIMEQYSNGECVSRLDYAVAS